VSGSNHFFDSLIETLVIRDLCFNIQDFFFSNVISFKVLTFGSNFQRIKDKHFKYCSCNNDIISFPSSITRIGKDTFYR
jgi:hypothetical protein